MDESKDMDITIREIDNKKGVWVALIGAIVTLTMYPWAFAHDYYKLIEIEKAKGPAGCENNVIWYYPAFTDIGLLSGVFFLSAAYGFYKRKKWAYPFAAIGAVMALKGSFWPMVPPMSNGEFPSYFFVFLPSLIVYLLLTFLVAKLSWKHVGFGIITGMAMITSFMNAIAATNRMQAVAPPANWIYVMTQRLNMVAGLAIGVVAVAVLVVPKKEWVKVTALTAGLLELIVGGTVATTYSIEVGRISFFFLGPFFTALMLLIMFTSIYDKIVN